MTQYAYKRRAEWLARWRPNWERAGSIPSGTSPGYRQWQSRHLRQWSRDRRCKQLWSTWEPSCPKTTSPRQTSAWGWQQKQRQWLNWIGSGADNIRFTTKYSYYKSLVVPIVLYGCDTWYLLADMEKQFRLSKTSAWEGSSDTRTQHKYQRFGTKHDRHIGRTSGTSTGNSQYTGLPGHVTRLDTVLQDTLEVMDAAHMHILVYNPNLVIYPRSGQYLHFQRYIIQIYVAQ